MRTRAALRGNQAGYDRERRLSFDQGIPRKSRGYRFVRRSSLFPRRHSCRAASAVKYAHARVYPGNPYFQVPAGTPPPPPPTQFQRGRAPPFFYRIVPASLHLRKRNLRRQMKGGRSAPEFGKCSKKFARGACAMPDNNDTSLTARKNLITRENSCVCVCVYIYI